MAKKMVKGKGKWKPNVERAARRQNRILELLAAGKSREQARREVGLSPNAFSLDLRILREGFLQRPKHLPPKSVRSWSPKRVGRAESLIKEATKLILGAKMPKKKARSKGTSLEQAEKRKKARAMLAANPLQPDISIARKLGIAPNAVALERSQLEQRKLIREVSKTERRKSSQRKPERETGVFSSRQIEAILEQNREKIRRKAERFYSENRAAFDQANVLPEEIAEEIAERLSWKLKIFDPKRMQGPEETKLARFFSSRLDLVAHDLKRMAWGRHRKTRSLEAGPARGMRMDLDGRDLAGETVITPERLELLSRALNLNLEKKAVLFGLKAGLEQKTIARALGMKGAMVNKIGKEIEGRIKKAIAA